MPSTNIKIVNENKILLDNPDYVLILAWLLKDRIISFFKSKKLKAKFIKMYTKKFPKDVAETMKKMNDESKFMPLTVLK